MRSLPRHPSSAARRRGFMLEEEVVEEQAVWEGAAAFIAASLDPGHR